MGPLKAGVDASFRSVANKMLKVFSIICARFLGEVDILTRSVLDKFGTQYCSLLDSIDEKLLFNCKIIRDQYNF